MKDYELTVLFHPDLEMNIDAALDKVKKAIKTAGGKITKEEAEGKKRLAYSINGQDFAIYYYFDVALPAEAPSKISSTFNIADEILRYLLVKVDARRAKVETEEESEEESEAADDSAEKSTKDNEEKGE